MDEFDYLAEQEEIEWLWDHEPIVCDECNRSFGSWGEFHTHECEALDSMDCS